MRRTDYKRQYESIFGNTGNCQVLDAQIDELGNQKNLIFQGKVRGDRIAIRDLLVKKEIQFGNLDCSRKLEKEVLHGSLDILNERFEEEEDAIIRESNVKRNTMLIGGGVVLLIALAIFIE